MSLDTIWIVGLAIVALAVIATIIGKSRGPGRPRDLGAVSPHWLAERRLSQPQDSDR